MGKFKRVREGDPIRADDFNAIAEALERFANLTVADGSYLRLWDGPDGKHLALHPPVETLALLSGATSPYSFVEVDEDAAGAFVTRGVGDSGTANVYEVNARAGLGGKVVPITWTAAGDWRFQYVGYSTVCAGTTRICVTITDDGCSPIGSAYGASVVVKDNTGATVGTCTTATSGSTATCCVSIANSGTYTVVTTIPGATPITNTVSASCDVDTAHSVAFPANSLGTVCFTFTHCGYANGGDTIVISKAGTPVATVTTDGSGAACARLGTGAYTAVLTTPQGSTKNLSFSVTACTTTNVNAGGSVTQVCLRLRTDPIAGCTASVTVKNQDTATTIGTGSLTTSLVLPGVIQGETCITVTEFILGTMTNMSVSYAFTNFTTNLTNQTPSCYTTISPLFADIRGAGSPC